MARYIDAERLCRGLKDMASVQYPDKQKAILGVVSTIENTPTADVEEVRHGEWIASKTNPEIMKKFHDMGIGTAMSVNSIHWTCSCCGTWGVPQYNYCTRCGARMDGGKNENLL